MNVSKPHYLENWRRRWFALTGRYPADLVPHPRQTREPRACVECGAIYKPRSYPQLVCSVACRRARVRRQRRAQ